MPSIRNTLTLGALLFVLSASSASMAQSADWSKAQRIEVDLSNFKYEPKEISLRHGQPYVLVFVNKANGGHDFVAKQFFAAASVAELDRAHVAKGEVELGGNETAQICLIAPPAGSYPVHCSHFMHSAFGMRGKILVQ